MEWVAQLPDHDNFNEPRAQQLQQQSQKPEPDEK